MAARGLPLATLSAGACFVNDEVAQNAADFQDAIAARLVCGRREEAQRAVTRYGEAATDCRHWFNTAMTLKGNIRVFCRVRPQSATESDAGHAAAVAVAGTRTAVVTAGGRDTKKYAFDRVFNDGESQERVFKEVAPLVTSALDGYNVCVFAYGQTGSGKTHTMMGNGSDPGVIPRTVSRLFALADDRRDLWAYTFSVAVLEIYNESIRDLLARAPASSGSGSGSGSGAVLDVRVNRGKVEIPGLTERQVRSAQDVDRVIAAAHKNRSVSATKMNAHSSRSHMVLRLACTATHRMSGDVATSKMHLVDLAGSERLSRSKVTGEQLRETKVGGGCAGRVCFVGALPTPHTTLRYTTHGMFHSRMYVLVWLFVSLWLWLCVCSLVQQHINSSLSALGDVIHALQSKNKHIPYRNSKLTYLLQDALGGSSKTLMMCQVSPCASSASETICTLNFAKRAASVQLATSSATANVQSGADDKRKRALAAATAKVAQLEAALEAAQAAVGTAKTAASKRAAKQLATAQQEAAKAAAEAEEARCVMWLCGCGFPAVCCGCGVLWLCGCVDVWLCCAVAVWLWLAPACHHPPTLSLHVRCCLPATVPSSAVPPRQHARPSVTTSSCSRTWQPPPPTTARPRAECRRCRRSWPRRRQRRPSCRAR